MSHVALTFLLVTLYTFYRWRWCWWWRQKYTLCLNNCNLLYFQ